MYCAIHVCVSVTANVVAPPPVSGYSSYHDSPGTVSPDFQRSSSVTHFNVEDGEEGGKEVEYFFASDARLALHPSLPPSLPPSPPLSPSISLSLPSVPLLNTLTE